jgi:hypothetical protein
MTRHQDTDDYDIDRRTILKSAAAASAMGLVGIPAFSGSAVGLEHDECPDDTVLLATENNHPQVGDEVMDVNIYAIYPAVGLSTKIETHSVPVDGSASEQSGPVTDNFNGNAWDDETQRFYFSRYDRMGPAGGNPLPSELYFTELEGDGTYAHAGTLEQASAGAAFYDGAYYYIPQRMNQLNKVTFNSDGTIAAETVVATGLIENGVLGFGDITFEGDVIYGSATQITNAGYTVVFFEINIDGTGFTVIETGQLYGAGGTQISFGKDGVLYGVNARPPYEVFSIDASDGSTSFIEELPVAFSDVSNGPRCEECLPCESGELLAKYEYECVETELTEEEAEVCVNNDFVFEKGDGDLVSYAGDFESKDGEAFEPISATFGTEYCSVWAVVKSGQEFEVQGFGQAQSEEQNRVFPLSEGEFTVRTANDEKYAISFVAFFCTEQAAQDFVHDFPSKKPSGPPAHAGGRRNGN